MGEEVGRALMSLHQQKGVQFCMEEEVAEFSGDSSLEAVLLKSDRRLKADLVVVKLVASYDKFEIQVTLLVLVYLLLTRLVKKTKKSYLSLQDKGGY